jgi:membrane-bound lytic murein transglycosylase MltF
MVVMALIAPADAGDGSALLKRIGQQFTGDLPEIRQRGVLRVLVVRNPTNYFLTAGRKRGFEYELLQQYGQFLEKTGPEVSLLYIPVRLEELLPTLIDGFGDVAAAGLTITAERQRMITFTDPYLPRVDEVVIAHRHAARLDDIESLSGRRIWASRGSSHVEHLRALSQRFTARGLAPLEIVEAHPYLQSEDLLEMANAGIVDLTVADSHIAQLWSNALDNVVLYRDVKINTEGKIGWAVRRDSPELLRSLNAFIRENKKGTLIGNVLFKRYYENTRWIRNPLSPAERTKLDILGPLFRKYAAQYGFDWLLIAAQAYQESGLEQNRRSAAGAVGIMQLRPSTARDKAVNISNIEDVQQNIHAGVKYLAHLRDTYFAEADLDPEARIHFALAAYNAGPGRVRQFRQRAREKGLDPDQWFYNVAYATAEIVGQETVRYVANIQKYYIAYRLVTHSLERRYEAVPR